MGTDKALLTVDGTPMALRVLRAAHEAGAGRLALVGGDAATLAEALRAETTGAGPDPVIAEASFLPDDTPGEGPLGAIVTALRHLDTPIVLIVACDLVRPSAEAMQATVQGLVVHLEADLALPALADRPQWLHAAWRQGTTAVPLEAAFARGSRAIHRAVADLRLVVASVPGIDPADLTDADSPADLL